MMMVFARFIFILNEKLLSLTDRGLPQNCVYHCQMVWFFYQMKASLDLFLTSWLIWYGYPTIFYLNSDCKCGWLSIRIEGYFFGIYRSLISLGNRTFNAKKEQNHKNYDYKIALKWNH